MTPLWPTNEFIQKNNYQEVKETLSVQSVDTSVCKHKVRFPMYPGGLDGIQAHIRKNLEYPVEAMNYHISGKVIVSYVVGKKGYIDEIKIKQSVNPVLDREAERVIKCMKRWIPGICDGEFVRVQYNQPIKFSIK